ncbi:g patch domain containing protein [Anaeramoeba flamelloides]|uniref:G patch domain containing protein n=1 Tax=Anaeramoeba flamelloides TaxID=1746091 RepID=A0ABQ8X988_9EUKA|nr:g patch domain containing protein [Anaeramoeba flamelloides]
MDVSSEFLGKIHHEEQRRKNGQIIFTTSIITLALLVFVVSYVFAQLTKKNRQQNPKLANSEEKRKLTETATVEEVDDKLGATRRRKKKGKKSEKHKKDKKGNKNKQEESEELEESDDEEVSEDSESENTKTSKGTKRSRFSYGSMIAIGLFFVVYFSFYLHEYNSLTQRQEFLKKQYDEDCKGGFKNSVGMMKRVKYFFNSDAVNADKEKFNLKCWQLQDEINRKLPSITRPFEVILDELGDSFENSMEDLGNGLGSFMRGLITKIGWKSTIFLVATVMLLNSVLKCIIPFH